MALLVQVPGACLIKTGTGAASALESLGYSINGVEVTEEMLSEDVPGDQNAGEGGNPIDIQDYGHIARIRMELSVWDFTIVGKIRSKLNAIAAGTSPTPGSLIFANSYHYRLLLLPTTAADAMNFPICVPRDPHVINLGAKFARVIFDWIAYPPTGGGVLWNTTTT
jgi:hypothetical protein